MPDLLSALNVLGMLALFIGGFVGFLFLLSRGLRAAQPALDKMEEEEQSLSIGNPLWPTIENAAQARYVSKSAAVVAFGLASLQLLGGIAQSGSDVPWWLVDVGIFVLIGLGLLRGSRLAAVAGLSFYALAVLSALVTMSGLIMTVVVAPFAVSAFVSALRATFLLSRLSATRSTSAA